MTNHSPLAEHCRTSEIVFSGNLLTVYRDEVILPNDRPGSREYIKHPGAVVVIPWLENDRIILERQYRYPLRQEFLELPAGKLNPDEDPFAAIKRELREETGYIAQQWNFLGKIHPCIGYANEEMRLYLAQQLTLTQSDLDDDELLEITEMTLDDALKAIRSGLITDAKTIIGLFWAEKWANGVWSLQE